MLAILTDPKNDFLIGSVGDAAAILNPPMPYKVIDFSMDHWGSMRDVTLFGKDIALSSAIIDSDLRPIDHIATRIGSVAGYLLRHLEETDQPESVIHSLDTRILFTTAGQVEDCEVHQLFRGFYTVISTKDRDRSQVASLIADWLREIQGKNTPRVFVSYRSTGKQDAEKVAALLRSRGAGVWFDDFSVTIGASITEEVNRGLGWCTHFVMLVDEDFFDSNWASSEFEAIMYRRLSWRYDYPLQAPILVPLFFVDPRHDQIPPMLQNTRGFDMTDKSVEQAVDAIWPVLTIVGRR